MNNPSNEGHACEDVSRENKVTEGGSLTTYDFLTKHFDSLSADEQLSSPKQIEADLDKYTSVASGIFMELSSR
jgi:hypothetical protein